MTPTQHRYNALASNLLFIAFFLPMPLDFITKQGFFNPDKPDANYVGVYAIMLVTLGLYYGIRRGLGWAKILVILLYVLSMLATAWHFDDIYPSLSASAATMFSFGLQKLLQVVALVCIVLSFTKKASSQPAPDS